MKRLTTAILAASVTTLLVAQQAARPLDDQRIFELAALGVSAQEMIRIIASAPSVNFDLRPGSTDNLMKAGVEESVIKAMAARQNGRPISSVPTTGLPPRSLAPASPTSATAISTASIQEVGIYYRDGGQWIEMMPEVVNWKTGGVLKFVATAGVVKEDVNGRIRYGKSKTRMTQPIELLVRCPDGTQITEYQLIRLRMHQNAREFRTVTGGIFHVSGDSNRDDLPFDSQRIAPHTWTIPLSGLRPGEYGLLPPGAIEARSASAQLGKMYTFTVVE